MNGMTIAALAKSIGQSRVFTAAMLDDFLQRGIAYEIEGEWTLTEYGQRAFGRPLMAADPTDGERDVE